MHTAIQMNHKILTLSLRSQTQKATYFMFPFLELYPASTNIKTQKIAYWLPGHQGWGNGEKLRIRNELLF